MIQIYNASPVEVRQLARTYTRKGIWSRTIQCYQRLIFLGNLHKNEYLRLALILYKQGKENQAERTLNRYNAIYKSIY